jgi:hypothetical protein
MVGYISDVRSLEHSYLWYSLTTASPGWAHGSSYTLIYTTTNHRLGPGQAITLNTRKLTGKSPRGISFVLDTFLKSIKQEKSDEYWPPPCFV